MSLSTKEINKIANLAKLNLPEDDVEPIRNDLNNILQLIAKMDEIDTSKIEPLAHPLNETQRLREDQVTERNQREIFQKNAPETNAGLYIVPKVIDNE